jgi:hypothetical protein
MIPFDHAGQGLTGQLHGRDQVDLNFVLDLDGGPRNERPDHANASVVDKDVDRAPR